MSDLLGSSGSLDQFGPLVAAVIFGLPAAAYAAVRVIRRDTREDGAIAVVERSLGIVEKDRDYWRDRAAKERAAADEVETRLQARIDRDSQHAASERLELYRQIEELRRALTVFTLHQDKEGN